MHFLLCFYLAFIQIKNEKRDVYSRPITEPTGTTYLPSYGRSVRDFKAIFCEDTVLPSQPRQLSVAVISAYSSSASSCLFLLDEQFFLSSAFSLLQIQGNKKPLYLSGVEQHRLSPSSCGNYSSSAGIGTLSCDIARVVVGFHRAGPSTHLDESRYYNICINMKL
jgi:hypothetical protein